jgi:hypothetical protein
MLETSPVEAPRRRRLFGRLCHGVLWVCGGVLLLATLTLGAGIALFAHGPVELAAVDAAARDVLSDLAGPGGRSRLGSARLDWSWHDGLSVGVTDIGVDRGDSLGVDVPRATIRLAILPIFAGEIRPYALVFVDPRFRVDLSALTGPSAGAAAPTGAAPAAPVVPTSGEDHFRVAAEGLGSAVAGVAQAGRRAGLRTIGLSGGTVETIRRDPAGQIRHAFVEDVVADAAVDGPAGALDVAVSARGEVGRWTARLTLAEEGADRRRLEVTATDLGSRDLFGPPSPGFQVGMPFDTRFVFAFDLEGRFTGADLRTRAGAGMLRFGLEPDDELLIDEGELHLVWRPQSHDFAVVRASIGIGESALAFGGRVAPPASGDSRWTIELGLLNGRFGPRDVPGPAMVVDSADLDFVLDIDRRRLEIPRARARFAASGVDTAGVLDFSGPEPKLAMDLSFPPLTADQVKHAWPHWVAPEARRWFVDNVGAGRISDLAIRLDMPRMDHFETWPNDAVKLSGRFDGLRFHPFGNLPEITGAEGRLAIVDRHFEVQVERGGVATKTAKRPEVSLFRLFLPDMFTKTPKAAIRFQLAGEVPAVAEIVNAEPLAVLDQTGIKSEGLAGTAAVSAQIDLVLARHIDPAAIEWKVEAQIDRFSNTQPIQGRKFQDGKFKILADPKGTKITGRAQIEGIGTDIDLFEPNGGSRAGEKRDYRMVLDDAARQRLGIDLGGVVQGAIGLTVIQAPGNEARRRIEVDLGPARVVLAPFGWTKSGGVPAKAVFDQIDEDKGTRIENLVVDSEGLTVRGSLQFDKDKRLVGADLGKFALRKGDDAKVKVSRSGDGPITASFEGAAFDLRGLMLAQRKPSQSSGGEKGADFNLKLRIARLGGFNDTDIGDVVAEMQVRDGVPTSLQGSARASGGRSFTASLKPEGAGRRLTLGSDDAGSVASFLDLFDRIKGGTLVFSAFLPAPGQSQGNIRISDFRLLEEPKSGRVAAPQTSADGSRKIAVRRAEFDRSTDFDRAQAKFAMRDGVIDVTDIIAKGKSVGATASGQIDVSNQRVALTGTYIPAFGLNNLAGQIPIIGAITGAGSNGGLVGVTFRVSGAIDDPILEINPLSAIAPGIFRRIFEFQSEDTGPRVDPNAPTKITP